MSVGFERHPVNSVVLCGFFSTCSQSSSVSPGRGLGARGLVRPWGQEPGNLVLAFPWPLAHSVALGLAHLSGPQVPTCHGRAWAASGSIVGPGRWQQACNGPRECGELGASASSNGGSCCSAPATACQAPLVRIASVEIWECREIEDVQVFM